MRIALRGSRLRIDYSGLKLSNICYFRTKKFEIKSKLLRKVLRIRAKEFAKKSKLLKISARVSGLKSSTKLTKFLLPSKVETTES